MVELDWATGAILAALEERGLADDTIVIFSSDNGPVHDDGYDDGTTVRTSTREVDRGHDASGPFRGGKYQIYEGGTGVPLLLRWPGRVRPGRSKALVNQIDLLASFAALLYIPLGPTEGIDSRNTPAEGRPATTAARIRWRHLRGTYRTRQRSRPSGVMQRHSTRQACSGFRRAAFSKADELAATTGRNINRRAQPDEHCTILRNPAVINHPSRCPLKKILLTSVCRPIGPDQGDAPSVGYELLHGQVTRAQGMFSPRSLHLHFSLEYVAENLEAPCMVLQYPSRRELIAELRKGYDYVGISFLLALFHRMKDVVALVRKHAPSSEIILGGYGTVLSDEVLAPYADHVCREEGVAFMRRLLGEPPLHGSFQHPLIVSHLKVFGMRVSKTGMVFAGLGCPNGCDFCCTSHFFKRRHIKLLATGEEIYRVVERYLELDPEMSLVVLDEDFLLNRRRALEFRDCVLRGGRALSVFVFASIRALSRFRVEELVEMGIDGLWIGYEGTRSNYAKQEGRDPEELFRELRQHGISILASMIVGMPYQDEEIVHHELDGLLRLGPDLCQFLIYGPTPGTPFFDRVMEQGLLHEDLAADSERYYKACDGFAAMVKHPELSPESIEALQRHCFAKDFQRLGPTIYRVLATSLMGYRTLRESANPALRRKAERFARDLRHAYPVFLAGRLFGPNAAVRRQIGRLQHEIHALLGRPSWLCRLQSLAAAGLALWTACTLKLRLFQHPRLVKHAYRLPDEARRPARIWRRLTRHDALVSVELRSERTIWVRLDGALATEEAARLAHQVRDALRRTRNRLVLDLKRSTHLEGEAAQHLADILRDYRERIRILVPATLGHPGVAAALAVFSLYHGPAFGS